MAILRLTAEITANYSRNTAILPRDIPGLISGIYRSLETAAAAPAEPVRERRKPAVSIKASVQHSYLVSLFDGRKLKMLKRHLRTKYGMSPEAYRAYWGLPADYPMVAPEYASRRSEYAKRTGLGITTRPKSVAVEATKARGRKAKGRAPSARRS